MPYLGNNLQVAFPSYRVIDDISSSFNGVLKTFALKVGGVTPAPFPINPQQCLISVNNIIQKPDISGVSGFTLNAGNIVFATAPTAGYPFFGVILAGADYVNAGVSYPAGAANSPSITFSDSKQCGFYLSSTNEVSVATSSTQRLVFGSSGTITAKGAAIGQPVTLTSSSSITPDFSQGNNFAVTLGTSTTLNNPLNLTAGQSGIIVITQDATGSRTMSFGSAFKFASGTAPTLTTTPNAVDILALYVESSSRITAKLIADVR